MLTEKEVCERAEYCYLICLQLNWMYANESIRPEKYLEQIRKSSLAASKSMPRWNFTNWTAPLTGTWRP